MGCWFQRIKRLIFQHLPDPNRSLITKPCSYPRYSTLSFNHVTCTMDPCPANPAPSGRTPKTPETEMPRFSCPSHLNFVFPHSSRTSSTGKNPSLCEADFGRIRILYRVQYYVTEFPHDNRTTIRQIPLPGSCIFAASSAYCLPAAISEFLPPMISLSSSANHYAQIAFH